MRTMLFLAISASVSAMSAVSHAGNEAPEDPNQGLHYGGQVSVISLVRFLNISALVRYNELGAGLGYSSLPGFVSKPIISAAKIDKDGIDASLDDFSAIDLDLRCYPFNGRFFLGSSLGRQHVKASVAYTKAATPIAGSVEVTTWYATPRVGWLFRWSSGFSLGVDLGVQLPLHPNTELNLPANAPSIQKDAADAAEKLARYPLPSFNFRVGYMY